MGPSKLVNCCFLSLTCAHYNDTYSAHSYNWSHIFIPQDSLHKQGLNAWTKLIIMGPILFVYLCSVRDGTSMHTSVHSHLVEGLRLSLVPFKSMIKFYATEFCGNLGFRLVRVCKTLLKWNHCIELRNCHCFFNLLENVNKTTLQIMFSRINFWVEYINY